MEERKIWDQAECEQYEDNLSVVTITPGYSFRSEPHFSKSDAQLNLIKKLKLFQQGERKNWKGVNVSTCGQPGSLPAHLLF